VCEKKIIEERSHCARLLVYDKYLEKDSVKKRALMLPMFVIRQFKRHFHTDESREINQERESEEQTDQTCETAGS
jgi:hypothetical protein